MKLHALSKTKNIRSYKKKRSTKEYKKKIQKTDYTITSQSKWKQLTNQDRLNIERWKNKERLSNREIEHLLNKAHGTIEREMKAGEIQVKREVKYFAKKAQEKYEGLRAPSVRSGELTN